VTTTVPPALRPQVLDGGVAPPTRRITSVNWTGDSVAYDLAPAVGAALMGAGLQADSNAYLGMRLIGDGEFALLPRLRTALPTTDFDVVVVQLSLWDAEYDAATQRAALDELHMLVVGDGGRLVLVSPPPTIDTARDDLLDAMTAHARTIAAGDPSSTYFLDSTAVWGAEFDADLDDDTPEERRQHAEAIKEEFQIVDVVDAQNDTLRTSDVVLRLQTLGSDDAYWLDTGILTVR
jgi:hypothetical protein